MGANYEAKQLHEVNKYFAHGLKQSGSVLSACLPAYLPNTCVPENGRSGSALYTFNVSGFFFFQDTKSPTWYKTILVTAISN